LSRSLLLSTSLALSLQLEPARAKIHASPAPDRDSGLPISAVAPSPASATLAPNAPPTKFNGVAAVPLWVRAAPCTLHVDPERPNMYATPSLVAPPSPTVCAGAPT